MDKVETEQNEPMSEWLKKDAVRLDLPDEEIITALCYEIEGYQKRIQELEGALGFYGDRNNWVNKPDILNGVESLCSHTEVGRDNGKRATEALKQKK